MFKKLNAQKRVEDKICEIRELLFLMRNEEEELRREMQEKGWKEFHFLSIYIGSHPECGEGDVEKIYFFAPHIDIPNFREFTHGHFDQSEENKRFERFIAGLNSDEYVELEGEETFRHRMRMRI